MERNTRTQNTWIQVSEINPLAVATGSAGSSNRIRRMVQPISGDASLAGALVGHMETHDANLS
jgi:hypothetical protein